MNLAQAKNDLNEMEKALERARTNEEARPLLDRAGYTLAAVAQGQALYDAAQAAITAQRDAVKKHTDLQTLARASEEKRDQQYDLDRAMAQEALKEDPAAKKHVQVQGSVAKTVVGVLNQMRALYDPQLDEAIAKQLADGGLTAEIRAEGLKLANAAQLQRAQAEAAEAKQVAATERRNKAIELALEWDKGFRKVARKALRDRPDLLKLFGLE